MNLQMDAQRDLLCFDLFDFDMRHTIFPFNAAVFITEMAAIATPTDHIPVFNGHYTQRVGTPNSFEAVTFYSDFTRLMNERELSTNVKQAILDFFHISFVPDPTIDLLCAEAFQPAAQITPAKRAPQKLSSQPKPKRSKSYNNPILRTKCDNCTEKDLLIKLTKKTINCNTGDLLKLETFWNGLKIEKARLATLPPIDQIDNTLHQELITLMENRGIEEDNYLNELLPNKLNQIKLDWYENRPVIQDVINVPTTESDASV